MNLSELKQAVEDAIESVFEYDDHPDNVHVNIQIDGPMNESVCSVDVRLIYDNDCQASGCVLFGEVDEVAKEQPAQVDVEPNPKLIGYCPKCGCGIRPCDCENMYLVKKRQGNSTFFCLEVKHA